MTFTFNLKDDPEFQALFKLCQGLKQEVADLRAQLPEWVSEPEAQRLTNLSGRTLLRLRDQGKLVWKQDHGIHYQRASLLAHNAKRAIGRGRMAHLLIVP
jgi:hypothetical protein